MKTMTCKQLGGACEQTFSAETFDEMVKMSQQHGMEMWQAGDEAHVQIMKEMKAKASDPQAAKDFFEAKKKEFDTLPEDN